MDQRNAIRLPDAANRDAPPFEPLPKFTDAEKQAIVQFAKAVVIGSVCKSDDAIPKLPDLGDIANRKVAGAFVTLKRNGRLRSCCGLIGARQELSVAIQRAARRTSNSDPRFPPIAVRELPYLKIDVTILGDFENVDLPAADRASGFTIGTHGLRISHGNQSGLLLPIVPVEFGWNNEMFLRQLCRKAKLEEHAWRDTRTTLQRFEGVAIHDQFNESEIPNPPTPVSVTQMRELAAACQRQIVNLLDGGALTELPIRLDKAFGVALKFSMPDKPELLVANINHRQPFELRSTLGELCRLAAQQIKSARLQADATKHIGCELIIFRAPAMHGLLVSPDLRGLNPQRHAIMCIEGDKVGWMFDDSESIHAVTRLASRSANIISPESTEVVSFDVSSTVGIFGHSTIGKTPSRSKVRPMAMAGKFYPIDRTALDELVDACVEAAPVEKEHVVAAMVPHAGLIYSGRVAGEVLKRIQLPEDIIVIGPKHTRSGLDWAMSPHQAWQIPGAIVPANRELAQHIVNHVEHLEFDAAAHKNEHAIEVLLPLINRLSPESRVTGIAIGKGDSFRCKRFGQQLAAALKSIETQPLLLISSDMNHFADDATNRRLDELALNSMIGGSPEELLQTVQRNSISMCGVLPACIVMEALIASQRLGAIRKVAYDTSARVNQMFNRVVGYAGVVIER